jgi:hypothetical protein
MSKEFRTESDDRRENLAGGMVRSPSDGKVDYTLVRKGPLFERWAALLARGAKVYGKNNWLLATESTDAAARDKTKARFAESAARHFEQWLSGDRSEDHAAAVLFNLNGYEHMLDTDGVAYATRFKVGDRVRIVSSFCDKWVNKTGVIEHDRATLYTPDDYGFNVRVDCGTLVAFKPEQLVIEASPSPVKVFRTDVGPQGDVIRVIDSKTAAPKVGDRVRVTRCDHACEAIGTFGTVTRVDVLDDEDLPFYVRLDAPIGCYGDDVWCAEVEVIS